MADVTLSVPRLEVKNRQTAPTFEVKKEGGGKLGELTPSSGGVYWLKVGQQGNPHFVTWAKFAEFMEGQDRKD